MFNNPFVKILIIVVLFFSVGYYFLLVQADMDAEPVSNADRSFQNLEDRELVSVEFFDEMDSQKATPSARIEVEIVNTIASTTQGLSGREEIGTGGMLFIFPDKSRHYFWMKDMKFDLDIVWIAGETIVDVSKNVPAPEPNTPDNRLETYTTDHDIDKVLELPAGKAAEYGIDSGDLIQLVE